MARKLKREQTQVHMVFNTDDVTAWKREADLIGISLSDWIRLKCKGLLVDSKAA